MDNYDVNLDDLDGVDYIEMWEVLPCRGELSYITEGEQNIS